MIINGISSISRLAKTAMLGLLMPFFLFAQEDTIVQTYSTVHIKAIRPIHTSPHHISSLQQEDIERLAPHDVGTVLQYVNGLTVKNYGGVGGMKTISHRGLGGEHTQLLIDGLPINDPQTGQINYATLPPNNIESISANELVPYELTPVSSLIKGGEIKINTFDQSFTDKPFSLRSSYTIGSFGQHEGFLALKHGGKKYFVSATGGINSYKGDYPYQLTYDTTKKFRNNNELLSYFASVGAGYKLDRKNSNHIFKITAKTNFIDQQLPGAVILYNDLSKETLQTRNTNAGLSYRMKAQPFDLFVFANYENRFLHYHDPNFLNSQGFLDNQYDVNSLVGGFHLQYYWNKLYLSAGNDVNYSLLNSNRDLGEPKRLTNTSMFKAKYFIKFISIEASVFHQFFIDNNPIYSHRKNYSKIHPQLAVYTSSRLVEDWRFYAFYRPSSRPPSFNDLYFSQVGNKDLEPEESSQITVGTQYGKEFSKWNLSVEANAFRNLVKNKILALPTKNLFIWSIQNIGEVDIWGADLLVKGSIPIKENWLLNLQVGVNYQKAVDVSDKDSPTYQHQIAYTPEWNANSMLSIHYKNIGLHLTSLYIGERYSLNENIESNRLEGYFNLDISASYQLHFLEKNKMTFQAGIKNATNASYDFVRYYIMPGINYFLKISYDFH